ncbi:hypothetical protein [Paraglaciecola sp.]|uniref:hypothetical protein n=1 Tax=Paraglaciecola sp. TaxID=1920173 RepID=UPI0030F375BD
MQYGLKQQTLCSILDIFAEQLNQTELFSVMEQLELLDLPYELDLSLYAQIENTNFIEHIERVGQVIYQRH